MSNVYGRLSRRSVLRLAATALGAGLLAACGGGPGATPTPKGGTAAAPKKVLRFWHNAGLRQALYEGQAKTFQEARPDIEVQVVFQGSGIDVFRKAQASMAAGDPPECTFMSPTYLPTLVDAKAIVDLESYIAADTKFNKNDLPKELWAAATWKSKIYMAPKDFQIFVLYSNKEMLDKAGLKPPKNWDELEQAAIALTQDTDKDGKTDIYGIDVFGGSLFNAWVSLLRNAGGSLVNADGTKVAFNGPEGLAALEVFDRLINKHKASPTAAIPQGIESKKAALQINGTWVTKNFYQAKVSFDVSRIPYKVKPLAPCNINGWGIWKTDTARQQATWDWVSFILSKGNYWTQVQSEYWIPIRDSHKQDPDFRAWLEQYPQLKFQVELPTSEFGIIEVTKAGAELTTVLDNALQQGVLGKKPLKQALDDAAAAINKLLV